MKRISFFVFFSLCIVFSCSSNSDSKIEALPKIQENNFYGDKDFLSAVNKILSGEKLSGGKEYYISARALNEGNGSEQSPFKSFSQAFKVLAAGDTLYVKGGIYREEIIIPETLKGNSQAYITIAGDINNSSENPAIISGKGAADNFVLLKIQGASYIRISSLQFVDSYGLDAAGIHIEAQSNHIIIDNCTFKEIKVPQPKKKDHVANGILAFGNGGNIKSSINNLLIYNNSFSDMATGWGECISVTGNCEFVNIIKNSLDNTGNIGIDVGGNYGYCPDPGLDFARYVYIAGNKVRNCESAYGDTAYGIYSDGGQHIRILENEVEHCSGGIEIGAEEAQLSEAYATLDVLVKNNSVYACKDCALAIGGYEEKRGLVRSVRVINNTFIDNADKNDGTIISLSKCDDVTITGNTFAQSNGNYKGEVLYKENFQKYPKNITIKDNIYKGLESIDE